MANDFEILNANVKVTVDSKNAEAGLESLKRNFDYLSKGVKLNNTLNDFAQLSDILQKGTTGFNSLNATIRAGGDTLLVTKNAVDQISFSLKNTSINIDELNKRFDNLATTSLNLDRSFSSTFTDIRDSIALVSSGGNAFVALQQSLFGLGQRGGLVGNIFRALTKDTDSLGIAQSRLQQAALRTSQKLGDIGLAAQDASNIIKQTAKEEGVSAREFSILVTQIQNVTNEYQRLERVIQTGGKPSAAELQRIRVETRGLETAFSNLTKQGIIPVGSETEKQLNTVIKSMRGGELATKQLTEIYKALQREEEKAAQKTLIAGQKIENAPKKGYFSWLNLFNLFKRGPSDLNSVNTSLNSVNSTISKTSQIADGLKFTLAGLTGGLIGGGLVTAIPAIFTALQTKFTGAIQAASDAAEEAGKFATVFDSKVDPAVGDTDTLVASMRDKLDEMAETLGRSKYELRKFAAAFQDTFVPLGFGREEAAKLSFSVTKLTEDLSSFYNMSEQQVSDRLSSFLVGNYENARAFGSIVTDARLDAELLKLGISGGTQAVDQQTKSLVALKLLYNDTADAQDDVTRTADSFANQLRTLQAQARDAAVELGNKLLVVLNPLLTAFIRLKNEIGPGISAAFNNMFNAISPFIDSLNTILSSGSIEDIFNSIVVVAQNGVLGVIETLDSLIPYAADWAYGWGQELYNGLLDVVDLVWDAVNEIASAMADMLMPGSPPKEGPLSTIDTWGRGLMDTFSSGLNAGSTVDKLNQELNQVTANLLKTRQEIIDAEKAGYVPPELKERLALEEQQQQFLKDQIAAQKNLDKEQTKANKQASKSSSGGGRGGSATDRPARERKETEKKTALEIYQENLRILDQQLKDGTIKYEDYARERLKIEKDFNESTLKEGKLASQENISNIIKFQDEVDKLSGPKGSKKDKNKLGLTDLGLTVEDFLPKPVDIKTGIDKVTNIAVTSITKKIEENKAKIQTKLNDTFQETVEQISINTGIDLVSILGLKDNKAVNTSIYSVDTTFDNFNKTINATKSILKSLKSSFSNITNVISSGNFSQIDFSQIFTFKAEDFNSLSDVFSDISTQVSTFFSNLIPQDIKDQLSSFATEFTKFVEPITRFFTDEGRLGFELIKLIQTIADNFLQLLAPALIIVGSLLGGGAGGAGGAAGAGLAVIIEAVVVALTALIEGWQFVEGVLAGLVRTISGAITIFGGFVDLLTSSASLIFAIFSGGDIESALANIQAAGLKLLTGFGDVFTGLTQVFLNFTLGIPTIIFQLVKDIATAIGLGNTEWGAQLIGNLDNLITIIKLSIPKAMETLRQLVTIGILILQDIGKSWLPVFSDFIEGVIAYFLELYNELIGNSIIPDMIVGILNAIVTFKTDFLGIISSLIIGTLDFFLGIGKSIIDSIITSIKENAGSLLSVFSTLFGGGTTETASSTVDTSQAQQILAVAQQVFITLTNLTGTLQNTFNSFVSNSLEYFTNITNGTLNTFISLRESLIGENSIVQEISDTVVDILISMGTSITQVLENIQQESVLAFKVEKWTSIGRFIVSGIQTGMSEKRDSFLAYVRKLAKSAIDTAADELGIKSPSIKFRELGISSVEGFELGLAALPPTTNNIAEEALDGISSVFKSFNEINRKVLKNATVDIFKANQDELIGLINKGGKEAQIRLAELLGDNSFIVKSGLNTMDVAGKFIESFKKSKEIMTEEFLNTGTSFVQGILGQQQDIINTFNTTLENVRYQTNSTRNAIEDAFKQPLTDEFLNSLYASVQNGETFGEQLDSQIKIAYLSQEKLNASLEDQQKIEEQIRAIQTTQIAIDDITKPINDIADTVSKETEALNLLDALKLGIDATAPDVLAKLTELANDMISKLNSTLQISSPSKVFMSIGENLGLGLINGLNATKDLIPATVQDISNSLTSALNHSKINQNGFALNSALTNNGRQLQPSPVNVTIQNTIGNQMDLAMVEQRVLNTVTKAIRR